MNFCRGTASENVQDPQLYVSVSYGTGLDRSSHDYGAITFGPRARKLAGNKHGSSNPDCESEEC